MSIAAEAIVAGEEGGTLELVFVSPDNESFLSGELALPLPMALWRINELFVSTHLPGVFDYAWTGGSLSPAPGVEFSYDIPTPGKRAGFHQFLTTQIAADADPELQRLARRQLLQGLAMSSVDLPA